MIFAVKSLSRKKYLVVRGNVQQRSNVRAQKCPAAAKFPWGKMSCGQLSVRRTDQEVKCPIQKMSCDRGEMTRRSNVRAVKCPAVKSHCGEMSYGQMSSDEMTCGEMTRSRIFLSCCFPLPVH